MQCRRNDEKACIKCGTIFRPRGKIRKHTAQYCSISCSKKGKIPPNLKIAQAASPITKKGYPSHLKGKKRKMSDQWRENRRKAGYEGNKRGEDHWNWKGGVTAENAKFRRTDDYKTWRINVYMRDRWTCQECGIHCEKGVIVAHHIKSFNDFPELRHDVDNGITYCRSCHASIHQFLKAA